MVMTYTTKSATPYTGPSRPEFGDDFFFKNEQGITISGQVEWTGYSEPNPSSYVGFQFYLQRLSGETWINSTIYGSDSNNGAVSANGTLTLNKSFSASFFASQCTYEGMYRIKFRTFITLTSFEFVEYLYINVYTYAAPVLPAFAAAQADDTGAEVATGTYAKLNIDFAVSPVGDNNTKALTVRWRENGTATWGTPQTVNISALGYTDSVVDLVVGGSFEVGKAYDFLATLTDEVQSVTNQKTMVTGNGMFVVNQVNRKIGIFGAPDPEDEHDIQVYGSTLFDVAPDYTDKAAARTALGIPRMCSGTATVSGSADSLTTLDVTFPAGMFSATPDVVATIKYGMGYSATNLVLIVIDPTETSATKVRFRIMRRGGAFTVDVGWVAMQMPS